MQSRKRFHYIERIRRIFFIKTELFLKVSKSIIKNKYLIYKTSLASSIIQQNLILKKNCISRHRIICPINSSFKIPNKRFRVSRFSLNTLIRINNIAGLLKRGW